MTWGWVIYDSVFYFWVNQNTLVNIKNHSELYIPYSSALEQLQNPSIVLLFFSTDKLSENLVLYCLTPLQWQSSLAMPVKLSKENISQRVD